MGSDRAIKIQNIIFVLQSVHVSIFLTINGYIVSTYTC